MSAESALIIELAFFSFGIVLLGRLFVDWFLRAQASLDRSRQHAAADPARQVERESVRTLLFAVVAGSAWTAADLGTLWLIVMAALSVSGLSGLYLARRLRSSPELLDQHRAMRANVSAAGIVRGRRATIVAVGTGLFLWVYSWRLALAALWRFMRTGTAL